MNRISNINSKIDAIVVAVRPSVMQSKDGINNIKNNIKNLSEDLIYVTTLVKTEKESTLNESQIIKVDSKIARISEMESKIRTQKDELLRIKRVLESIEVSNEVVKMASTD